MNEPFDDQEFLRLLDHAERNLAPVMIVGQTDLLRLCLLGGKLMEEVIRLRERSRLDRITASLLEQGQQTLFQALEAANTPLAERPHLSTENPTLPPPRHAN